ncbi:MAG: hypothetical protein DWG76_01375 [Chloroflexi bacterium]|nr:hypothetical protein [Chloroflexota bacterium]
MDDGEAKSAYYFVGYDPDDFDEYHSQNIFMGREAAGAEVVENGEYEVSLRFGGISLDNATIKRSAWMVLSANGDDSSINEFVT